MAIGYYLTVGVFMGIFSILTISLNILTGYAKQVSLGHAAFFGIGAYTSAMLTTNYGLTFWQALPCVIIITAFIGTLLGLPSLRVSHDFLVLSTIGLNFIVGGVFRYFSFFGGSMGIIGVPPPRMFGSPLGNMGYFLLTLAFLILTILTSYYFSKTWGRLAMEAMGEDEIAAKSMGINVPKFKTYAFALSSAYAGIAGALWAHYVGSVFPGNFSFDRSVAILSMLVFGGMGTIRGALLGAFLLRLFPELFRFIQDYRMLVYGGILVVMIRFQPMGLLGKGSVLWNGLEWFARKIRGGPIQEGTT
ncbi:MAG: branched-chain amino acid ABC transporter permease [Candidatus Bipolaricaulota bacterium]|nr:branched-chain amino acid ABC transporter permease [Candidatus Bipolaricaulota bacterium]